MQLQAPSASAPVDSSKADTADQTSSGTSAIISPITPPEKLKVNIAKTPRPWSTALLSLAANGKEPVNVVDSAARRSLRQKGMHKGYKGSPCTNKNYLGCSMDAPFTFHYQELRCHLLQNFS